MTASEAVNKLNAIDSGDTETAHIEADAVLIEFLKGVKSAADVVAAFEAVQGRCGGFWYA